MMRKIDMLIVHCSATPPAMDIGAKEIREWHIKGNGWKDIGYHFIIRRDGRIEDGRPVAQAGAHVAGKNAHSIGVCLVGGVDTAKRPEANFTTAQWSALARLMRTLKAQHPKATIHGHNEFAAKACPSFNVQDWLRKERI